MGSSHPGSRKYARSHLVILREEQMHRHLKSLVPRDETGSRIGCRHSGRNIRNLSFTARCLSSTALGIVFAVMTNEARATCLPGSIGGSCTTANGKHGHWICGGGYPVCIPDPPPPV